MLYPGIIFAFVPGCQSVDPFKRDQLIGNLEQKQK
jgi:hypothetical protein